jgi:hypothetical protein
MAPLILNLSTRLRWSALHSGFYTLGKEQKAGCIPKTVCTKVNQKRHECSLPFCEHTKIGSEKHLTNVPQQMSLSPSGRRPNEATRTADKLYNRK